MRILLHALLLGGIAVLPLRAAAQDTSAKAEQSFRQSFSTATPEEWATRLQQDEVNALCSKYRNHPPPEVAAARSAPKVRSTDRRRRSRSVSVAAPTQMTAIP